MSTRSTLTAWERWELASFDTPGSGEMPSGNSTAPAPLRHSADAGHGAVPPKVSFTPEELAALRQSAYDEAFARGRAAGHAEGLAAGTAEGERSAREALTRAGEAQLARLVGLLEQLDAQIVQLDGAVAEQLLDLAIAIARKLVGQALVHHPEHIVGVVHEALAQLPVQHATIHLHPEDAQLLRLYAGDTLAHAGHRLHESARINRGDVLIDAAGSHVDASLASRWRRVVAALGKETAWGNDPPSAADAPPNAAETAVDSIAETVEAGASELPATSAAVTAAGATPTVDDGADA